MQTKTISNNDYSNGIEIPLGESTPNKEESCLSQQSSSIKQTMILEDSKSDDTFSHKNTGSSQAKSTTSAQRIDDLEKGDEIIDYFTDEPDDKTAPDEDGKKNTITTSMLAMDNRSKTNGTFFAYMVIGAMIFCPIALIGHVTAFFYAGRRWQLGNYAGKLLGYEEMTKTSNDPATLNFHAFFGMFVLLLLAFQPVSFLMFSRNKSNNTNEKQSSWLRVAHKYLGRALVAMILIASASGMWYVSVSRDWGDQWWARAHHNFSFAFGFVIISTNLTIGIYAVSGKKKEKKKDYLLHKAAMAFACFQMFWTSFPHVFGTIIQLGLRNVCGLGGQGYMAILSLGYTIQLIVLVAAVKRYDSYLFQMKIVRYNLMAFTAFTIFIMIALLSLILSPPEDDTCFGTHSTLYS